MQVPVTSSDLESKIITRIARSAIKDWPSESPPKLSEAQQLIAKSFGYKDLHDLTQSAQLWLPAMPVQMAEDIVRENLEQLTQLRFYEINIVVGALGLERLACIRNAESHVNRFYEAITQKFEEYWYLPYSGVPVNRTYWPTEASLDVQKDTFSGGPYFVLGPIIDRVFEQLDDVLSLTINDVINHLKQNPNDFSVLAIQAFSEMLNSLADRAIEIATLTAKRPDLVHPDKVDQESWIEVAEKAIALGGITTAKEHLFRYAHDQLCNQTILAFYRTQVNAKGFYSFDPKLKRKLESGVQIATDDLDVFINRVRSIMRPASKVEFETCLVRAWDHNDQLVVYCVAKSYTRNADFITTRDFQDALEFISGDGMAMGVELIKMVSQDGAITGEALDQAVNSLFENQTVTCIEGMERSTTGQPGQGAETLLALLRHNREVTGLKTQVLLNGNSPCYVRLQPDIYPRCIIGLRNASAWLVEQHCKKVLSNAGMLEDGTVSAVRSLDADVAYTGSDLNHHLHFRSIRKLAY